MSKYKLTIEIKRELKRLNKDIDMKIIKGLPYHAEARRHKFLISQFYIFNHSNGNGLFRRLVGTLASFVL